MDAWRGIQVQQETEITQAQAQEWESEKSHQDLLKISTIERIMAPMRSKTRDTSESPIVSDDGIATSSHEKMTKKEGNQIVFPSFSCFFFFFFLH